MKKDKITFKELAKLSNVSIGTLSRYFNNGFVSQEKKKMISHNIKRYGFIKNAAASKIKKQNNETIIIRTFFISGSQDHIIEGIISTLEFPNDAIIKYSNKDEKSVIKTIDWAIKQRPLNLIIFSPFSVTVEFGKTLKQINNYTNVVVYDYKNNITSSVVPSFNNAFKELAIKNKKIHFIYNDKNDTNSFTIRLIDLRNHFEEVIIEKENFKPQKKDLYMFQSEKLRIDTLQKNIFENNSIRDVSINYQRGILSSYNSLWIFIDYFLIGCVLVKLLKDKKCSRLVEGKLIT